MSGLALPKMTSHGDLMRGAAWTAVAVAGILVMLKAGAYVVTGSVAMLASLADSGLDLVGSTINLVAVGHSLTPADREHRFGHGKAEPLAGLAQGAFICASALFLVVESISRLITPRPISHELVGLGVMGLSIAAVFALVVIQRFVVRRTGSIAIAADSLHYIGDLLTNGGVIVGIVLATQFGWLRADPVMGLIIAGILSISAWQVFRQSYDQLMDHELPEDERARIKQIVMGHGDVVSLHDLRTRSAGISTFIQMHIELDPALSLTRAHEVSDAVEADLHAAYPHAEVIIHQDPAGVEMPEPLAQS